MFLPDWSTSPVITVWSSPVKISSNVKQPLDDRRILGHTAHVEDVLSVVLVGQVDVVQEEGEVYEKPFSQMKVNSGSL